MKRVFAGLLAGVLLVACSGGGKEPSPGPGTTTPPASETPAVTATPTVTGTATPTATPAPFGAKRMMPGDPVPFPAEVVMYATDAVWEGPTAALRRYYRDTTGLMRADVLLESAWAQDDQAAPRAIVGVVVGGPGEMGATLCHGSCYGASQPVTIVRSSDGGVTWREVLELPAGGWGTLVALDGEGLVVRGVDPLAWWEIAAVRADGSMVPVPVPAGVANNVDLVAAAGATGAVVVGKGEDWRTLWQIYPEQKVFGEVPAGVEGRFASPSFVGSGSDRVLQLRWWDEASGGAPGVGYLGFLRPGAPQFEDVYMWSQADGLAGFTIAGWVSPTVAIGRAEFDGALYGVNSPPDFFRGIPALIDFERGIASPIAEFLPALAAKAGGPMPHELLLGLAARVEAQGECLHLREAPATTGASLGCFADGVILRLRGEGREDGGRYWYAVETPDGRDGWAAGEFLVELPTRP